MNYWILLFFCDCYSASFVDSGMFIQLCTVLYLICYQFLLFFCNCCEASIIYQNIMFVYLYFCFKRLMIFHMTAGFTHLKLKGWPLWKNVGMIKRKCNLVRTVGIFFSNARIKPGQLAIVLSHATLWYGKKKTLNVTNYFDSFLYKLIF